MPVLRDEGQRRGYLVGRETTKFLGRIRDEFPIEAQKVSRVLELEEHGTAVDVLDGMQT